MRLVRSVVVLLLALCSSGATARAEFDDCDANFIAFIGSDSYQFSPKHDGELGSVRLFSILSYQRAAHEGRHGFAYWKLVITRAGDDAEVLSVNGLTWLGREGAGVAEFFWDGRDAAGSLVPEGMYRYTFLARHTAGNVPLSRGFDYEQVEVDTADEALASTDSVLVNYRLSEAEARHLRRSLLATSCQPQQNAPMEAGFGYSFYYGSTHSHSNWSDGGQPTTSCSSGNAYGSGTYAPGDVYTYARESALLDFWVVNEHNHLIQDAIANNNGPVTEAKVRQRYQDGIAASNAATTADFVGLYGMEWGVSSNPDQGHVTLIETPKLFGWETCSTCNGPDPECTPGTDCYFDVFTPKRYGYLTLYARSVENPSSAGALGIFNHPGSSNFDGFAFDANADDAIQGVAVRSGLAFSTATDCSAANVGATDYSTRWKEALNKGFHVAPVADHDSHCNNYGVAIPTRTVYLSPTLSKANIMAAHKARHFYATEDSNMQLVFRTGDGAKIMGDIFTASGGATLVVNVYDPDAEATSTIEIWRGQIGAGVPSAAYQTWSGVSSASITESLTSGTYYYYAHVVQADGHDAWSAPMWITYGGGGGGDTTAPTTSITAPADGSTVSGVTLVTAAASDDVGVAKVEFYLDGALASTDTTAPYEWSWDTTTASNASHSLVSKAWDAALNSGSSATVTVTVSNGGGGTPSGTDVSGWKVTQTDAVYEYVIPAGTVIPSDGYLVIARNADKASFETFWGRTLGTNVVFLSSGGTMPVINGSETYSLYNGAAVLVDGATIAMGGTAGQSIQRTDLCASASLAGSWSVVDDSLANAGSGAPAGCGGGVKISEFSDATGTGNYVYEFIELHDDSAAAADTTAPTTSITAPAGGSTVSGTTTVAANATDDVGVAKVEFYLDSVLQATDTASPYEWAWDTTTATNGTHTLGSKAFDAAGNSGASDPVSVTVDNDVTPPTTSITAPAAGATVSGVTTVTASASDNVGVARVEFHLDGALQSTDTASPYEWSWDTTAVPNGAHTLSSKAFDAAGNAATSATVDVTVSNVTGTDVSNWKLVQASSSLTYYLPAGTVIPANGYVVVGRNAARAEFEAFWGVTLGTNVVYINSGGAMPQINGSETYTLYTASGTKRDGATIAMASGAGESIQRKNPCGGANKSSSWTRVSASSANPGSGAPAPCGEGVYIGEFSDALGTGNYIYEFVELQTDK